MENKEQQILSEIKSLMASVREQLQQLDEKMAQLQQVYEPQEFDAEPIEMDFDVVLPVLDVEDLPVHEEIQIESDVEPVAEPVAELLVEPAAETVAEPVVEPSSELVNMEVSPAETVDSTPVAVIDVMATRHAWRTDMPGSPVKDIRAAIALVDRALFINSLFQGDAMAFLSTLDQINKADTLDEVVSYLAEAYPQWDFESDVVYRFMMAVRRKIAD